MNGGKDYRAHKGNIRFTARICKCILWCGGILYFLLVRIRLKRKFYNGRRHIAIPSFSETDVNTHATLLRQRQKTKRAVEITNTMEEKIKTILFYIILETRVYR